MHSKVRFEDVKPTVNDRLSAAALIFKIFPVKGRALIQERRLFENGAYFNYG